MIKTDMGLVEDRYEPKYKTSFFCGGETSCICIEDIENDRVLLKGEEPKRNGLLNKLGFYQKKEIVLNSISKNTYPYRIIYLDIIDTSKTDPGSAIIHFSKSINKEDCGITVISFGDRMPLRVGFRTKLRTKKGQ